MIPPAWHGWSGDQLWLQHSSQLLQQPSTYNVETVRDFLQDGLLTSFEIRAHQLHVLAEVLHASPGFICRVRNVLPDLCHFSLLIHRGSWQACLECPHLALKRGDLVSVCLVEARWWTDS